MHISGLREPLRSLTQLEVLGPNPLPESGKAPRTRSDMSARGPEADRVHEDLLQLGNGTGEAPGPSLPRSKCRDVPIRVLRERIIPGGEMMPGWKLRDPAECRGAVRQRRALLSLARLG